MKLLDILTIKKNATVALKIWFKATRSKGEINLKVKIVSDMFTNEWLTICTARGGVKVYKSFDACIADIDRVYPTNEPITYRLSKIIDDENA